MPHKARTAVTLLVALVAAWIAWPAAPAQAKPPLQRAIKRQQMRNEYTRFEPLIDALGIAPGMTILDIGAGPGYASFLFAEKLRRGGEVYATDIRKDFVDRIGEEAKRRGLSNLFPVLVTERGLDDFYGRHRYDLVFLSNVYHCLEGRVEYFSRLRAFLARDARLVLVLYNQAPLFSAADLADVDGIVGILAGAAEDDPFVARLSPATRRLLGENAGRERIAAALVEDFNRMLLDPRFYEGFYKESYFSRGLFDASGRDFANWLLMTLGEDGALDRPAGGTDARAMRAVIRLNRLFFAARFGDRLANRGAGAYVPAGDANRHTSKYAVLRELDAAGYGFVKELTLSPYFDAVIMAPKTQ